MEATTGEAIYGPEGFLGWAAGTADGGRLLVELANGRRALVEPSQLRRISTGELFLPLGREEFARAEEGRAEERRAEEGMTIPLAEERLEVSRRLAPQRKVVVRVRPRVRQEVVSMQVLEEQMEVERVPVHQLVERPPGSRQEGDTLVIPLVEEVLVVQKRLAVKEELRIRRIERWVERRSEIPVRYEEAEVERYELAKGDEANSGELQRADEGGGAVRGQEAAEMEGPRSAGSA